MIRYMLIAAFVLASLCGTQGYPALAAAAVSLDDCAKIDDDAARLRCYDEAAGRKPKEAPARITSAEPAPAQPSKPSYLSMKWQLDEESRKGRFAIMPYQAKLHPALHVQFHAEQGGLRSGKPGNGYPGCRGQVPDQPEGEAVGKHPRHEHGPLVRLHAALLLAGLQHGISPRLSARPTTSRRSS